ncbi:hypothetical protein BH20ACT22_BH20ACT22_20300 [soil metagenome]
MACRPTIVLFTVLFTSSCLFVTSCASDASPPRDTGKAETQTNEPEDEPSAIAVSDPVPGASVTSPVRIAGEADVFEATVSIRIRDASGAVIQESFTTATCGTGCRGNYSEDVRFEVAEQQEGTIQVFWESPEDGSPQDVVRIPVSLIPDKP